MTRPLPPIKETGKPVSTNLQVCGGAIIPGDKTLGALDQDFHTCGLVTSVTLKSDVSDNVNDSFYKGTVLYCETSGTACKPLYKWVSICMEIITIKTCSCNSNFNVCYMAI